jgi:hypothetical protein
MRRWADTGAVLAHLCLWSGVAISTISAGARVGATSVSGPAVSLSVTNSSLTLNGDPIVPLRDGVVDPEYRDSVDPELIPELFTALHHAEPRRSLTVRWVARRPDPDLQRQIATTAQWAGVRRLSWSESL